MIDDDDAAFVALAMPSAPGWLGVAALCVVLWFVFMASSNEDECRQQECGGSQSARLIDGECVCVGKPVTP